MSAGTKIFLAVFGVMVGAMVLYYTTVGGQEGEPPVVRGAEDPLLAANSTRLDEPRPQGPGIVPNRNTSSAVNRAQPTLSPEAPAGGQGSAGTPVKQIVAPLPPIDGAPGRLAKATPSGKTAEPKPAAPKPGGIAAVNLSEKADRPGRGTERPTRARQPRPKYTDHFVQPGETMSSIAARWFGDANKWELIAKANPTVDPNTLQPGDLLRLPAKGVAAAPPTPVPTVPTGARTHVVRSGDSLSTIAGVVYGDESKWLKLYEANRRLIGPDPHRLKVGMKLAVPE